MYVHKPQRLIVQSCAESPGRKTSGDSGTSRALDNSQLWVIEGSKKTPLRKRPDCEQMTARCKGLMQTVSKFPRAITSAVQLKHRLCTLLQTTNRRRAGRNGLQDPNFTPSRPKAPRNMSQRMYPLSNQASRPKRIPKLRL